MVAPLVRLLSLLTLVHFIPTVSAASLCDTVRSTDVEEVNVEITFASRS